MAKPISGFNITTKRVKLRATGLAAVVYACGMVLVSLIPVVGGISAIDRILHGNWIIYAEIHIRKRFSNIEKE